MWRAGDGKQVHIWKDMWLPQARSNRIQSSVHMLSEDALVVELIDTSVGWSNMDLLRAIFNQADIYQILQILVIA